MSLSIEAHALILDKPKVLYVDTDDTPLLPCTTIDKIINTLKEHGPLVVLAKIGPMAHTQPPFSLKDKISDWTVKCFLQGTFKENAPNTTHILLGARKDRDRAYVYFTKARDFTSNQTSLVRGFKPSRADDSIYMISYDTFLARLVDLHQPLPQGNWLFSVPAIAIIDRGEQEKKCKNIGQEIFDQYKAMGQGGKAIEGIKALQRICEAAKFLEPFPDGHIRAEHIAFAWDGVGYKNLRWMR